MTTRLEQLVQQKIDLFLDSDTTKETYSIAVATVIKEAREDLLRDVEKCLGRDLDKAIEQLTWLDELIEEEAILNVDLMEDWKDKEEEPDWSAQDAMQADEEPGYIGIENHWRTWDALHEDLNDHLI